MIKRLLAALSLIVTQASAQTSFQVSVDMGANEHACDIKQTPDGGYIISGLEFVGSTGSKQVFLLKLDSEGTVLWNKTYTGAVANGANLYQNYRVLVTTEGSYVVVGAVNVPGSSTNDIFVMKTDPNGDTLWTRTYGGTSNDDGNSIFEASNGDYIVGGSVLLNSQRRMAVLRIAPDGTLLRQTFLADGLASPFFETVSLDVNRYGVIRTYSSLLTVVDSTGTLQWSWPLQFSSAWSVQAIAESNGQFCVFSGVSGLVGGSYALTRADQSGVISLSKKYTTANDESPRHMLHAANGDYLIYGLSTSMNGPSAPLLARIDSNGAVVWAYNYRYAANAYHEAGKVIATSDGGFAMVGQYDRSGNYTDFDVYVVKTDAAGLSGCNQSAITLNVTSGNPVTTNTPSQYTGVLPNSGTPFNTTISSIPTVSPTLLCLTLGESEMYLSDAVRAYPTLFRDYIHVESDITGELSFIVTDALGRSMAEARTQGDLRMDTSAWPNGIYLLTAVRQNGEISTIRLVKYE